MNRQSLIKRVSLDTGMKGVEVERALNRALGVIQEEVEKGGTVRLEGFGTFLQGSRNSRAVRVNGQEYQTKASRHVKFRPHANSKFEVPEEAS